jgi:hypothetical protein
MSTSNALIVIRHGQDLDGEWATPATPHTDPRISGWIGKVNANWPAYTLQDGVKNVFQHGLSYTPQKGVSEAGEDQARNFGSAFAPFVSANSYAPVGLVITKNPFMKIPGAPPSADNPTPNPFDTVYPFTKTATVKLKLIDPGQYGKQMVDPGLQSMIDDKTIIPSNGSTLLCWDAEGLWGPSTSSGRPFSSDSILWKVSMLYLNNVTLVAKYSPLKCQTVYVFTTGNLTIYMFTNGVFKKVA